MDYLYVADFNIAENNMPMRTMMPSTRSRQGTAPFASRFQSVFCSLAFEAFNFAIDNATLCSTMESEWTCYDELF